MCLIKLYEPTILDAIGVMKFRQDVFDAKFQFKGSNSLDQFDNYIDWLAHTINSTLNTAGYPRHQTLLAKLDGEVVAIVEIFYSVAEHTTAHIVECISPLHCRKGYGEKIVKLAIDECNACGLRRCDVTNEISKRIIPKNAETKLLAKSKAQNS